MGIDLMVNFHAPYFATGPREFWRRWHISLSSWLRDYLYIPLGGNRASRFLTNRNLLITMLLGGLWHGAAWTFVTWGFIHALFLMGGQALNGARLNLSRIPVFMRMVIFFHLVCVTWVFFRAQSIGGAFDILHNVATNFTLSALPSIMVFDLIRYAGPLLLLQYVEYRRDDPDWLVGTRWPVQGLTYAALILLLIVFGETGGNEFIYFQF
jgi:D-alanyl-lipoteichoic acid acyltransferase DltB (MBOAT superfamily)